MHSVRCGEQPGLSLREGLSAVKSHHHGPSLRTPRDSLQCRHARHAWKERKQIKAVGQWRGLGTRGHRQGNMGPSPCLQISERHRVPCFGPEGLLRPRLYQSHRWSSIQIQQRTKGSPRVFPSDPKTTPGDGLFFFF